MYVCMYVCMSVCTVCICVSCMYEFNTMYVSRTCMYVPYVCTKARKCKLKVHLGSATICWMGLLLVHEINTISPNKNNSASSIFSS